MNIHEYQAKSLLQKFGVAVPQGGVAYTPQEAGKVAKGLAGPVYVVKAQIHAGGRGAGRFADNPSGKGGVRVVKSTEEVAKAAAEMLGHVLVTKQTGPKGREVKRIYVEEGCDIKRELYLGMLIDRKTSRITVMASTEGGMEIEEVAAKHPEKILRVGIDPVTGMQGFHARELAFGLGLEGKQIAAAICLTSRPSPKASSRAWKPCIPVTGSIATRRIFSGCLAATSSISMPPSVEAMTVMREVLRSISMPR